METAGPTFESITPVQWQRLASQRIFFGHQSVGGNLLEGVRELLSEHSSIRLRAVEITKPTELTTPALYHALVGRNGDPASKLAAFREIVSGAMGDKGIALLKYCYVDITLTTDAKALFEQYRSEVEALEQQHPGVTFIHVTLPLEADAGTLRYLAAVARGLPTNRDLNLIRHHYNELLRSTYGGKDPIFDLARLEATGPDGRPVVVRHERTRVPVMARAWTYDGGHLNEAGRRHMAKAFLATLAMAQERGASAP
jgi:hypothetical protein